MNAEEFLKIADQFRLGNLVTECSHPVTASLSQTAEKSIKDALKLLFTVDDDITAKYEELIKADAFAPAAKAIKKSMARGGKIIFTGCGATGRLSILLDSMWKKYHAANADMASRSVSLMAGGDFALIKSVEGFEDITSFGREQLRETNISSNDILFAITEGGETSWVIGTALEGADAGATVYFVYNNPDDILKQRVIRSREIIEDARISKVNLTTGPMAITGSTRMQATTMELAYMATVIEMALTDEFDLPQRFLASLKDMISILKSDTVLNQLERLVKNEVKIFKGKKLNNYFASDLAIDILTDTTERSPTFCIPPFRAESDRAAADSWSYLYTDAETSAQSWQKILNRPIRAVEWDYDTIEKITDPVSAPKHYEIIKKISEKNILDFKTGRDGLYMRPFSPGCGATAVTDKTEEIGEGSFFLEELKKADAAGAFTGLIYIGREKADVPISNTVKVIVPLPEGEFVLESITRLGIKMLLNAFSTCVMTAMGAVLGNYMIHVVPSNLKLIDRSARYIQNLTGESYEDSVALLFEVIDYISPRMTAGEAYPPAVQMSVLRAKYHISNEEAEDKINNM